ncbi:putative transposase [Bacilli bacterium PM5-9]|nr:putative transposase [Bacilli bacterium PM5-9]
MCKCLKISRSGYYSYKKKQDKIDEYNQIVINVFNDNQRVYGTRKIKAVLAKQGIVLSRRRIARIMKYNGLVSAYTVKKYRSHKTKVNEANIENKVNREFNNRVIKEVIVSDLTYVRVLNDWHYICIIIDLYNREIVGYSCGKHKDAKLVYQAFSRIKSSLYEYEYFHSDRGSEFDNYLIEEILNVFNIEQSLSRKGNPYDNAVAEATFKLIKTEFVYPRMFNSLIQLELELAAYVSWFNNDRVHSTLGYQSPVEYRVNDSL